LITTILKKWVLALHCHEESKKKRLTNEEDEEPRRIVEVFKETLTESTSLHKIRFFAQASKSLVPLKEIGINKSKVSCKQKWHPMRDTPCWVNALKHNKISSLSKWCL